jgi:hypothetical protein
VKHRDGKRMMHPTCVVCSQSCATAGTNDTIGDDRRPLSLTWPPIGMVAAVVAMSGLTSLAMTSRLTSPVVARLPLSCVI